MVGGAREALGRGGPWSVAGRRSGRCRDARVTGGGGCRGARGRERGGGLGAWALREGRVPRRARLEGGAGIRGHPGRAGFRRVRIPRKGVAPVARGPPGREGCRRAQLLGEGRVAVARGSPGEGGLPSRADPRRGRVAVARGPSGRDGLPSRAGSRRRADPGARWIAVIESTGRSPPERTSAQTEGGYVHLFPQFCGTATRGRFAGASATRIPPASTGLSFAGGNLSRAALR